MCKISVNLTAIAYLTFNEELDLFHLKSQSVPRSKHSLPRS